MLTDSHGFRTEAPIYQVMTDEEVDKIRDAREHVGERTDELSAAISAMLKVLRATAENMGEAAN